MSNADYVSPDDGLLYCGKCNTRKETVVKLPVWMGGDGTLKKVPCLCRCASEEKKVQAEKEEERQRMFRIQRMRESSMMDVRYRDADFNSFRVTQGNKRAGNIAQKYAVGFDQMFADNQGLILYGPVGTGKSYTAACIANYLLARSVPVVMTSFVKILQMIQRGTGDEQTLMSALMEAKLLILDDMGSERSTDFALEKIYNVVDSRSRSNRPMIVTTNVSLDEMLHEPDIRFQRIYDRIFETCYPVEISGESFRRITAAERFDAMQRVLEG